MENYLTQITNYLLTQSWQIAILVVLIALVNLALKNKSAHVRYLLWLIVLAKCLVPPLVTIPLAILPQDKMPEPTLISRGEMPAVNVEMAETVTSEPIALPSLPVTSPTIMERLARVTARQWLGFGWIVGVAAFLLFAVIKALRTDFWLWRQRKLLPAELQIGIENLFSSLGIKTLPRVWLVEGIGQPFVWGLLRGSIYLPANFVKVDTAEHRRGVLGHELSHILRFDAAVNILQIISQAVFWFHPFIWWANKKIRAEREKCCDEMAIARLGAEAKDYSSAIVNILISEYKSTRPVPSLAIAGPVKNIEERIKTMLRPGKKFYKRPSLTAATIVLLLALLTVPTAVVLTARAETKPTTEQKAEPAKSLHEAARDGDIELVKSLISKGADVNAMSGRWGGTPLHLASSFGHRDVVEFLIASGTDVNAKNKYGRTPLHDAIGRGQTETVELLRKHGAETKDSVEPEKTKPGKSLFEVATTKFVIPKENLEIPEQMQSCAANLQKIYAAIKKYEKDKGRLPNWLSDLVPDYLSKEMLLCPYHPNYRDVWFFGPHIPVEPKLPCSYRYQFSMARLPAGTRNPACGMITRDRKTAQMRPFGDVVPLLRCYTHGDILNLSVGGQLYVSRMVWEKLFMQDYIAGLELYFADIHLAAYLGDLDKVRRLVEEGADVKEKSKHGIMPLTVAVLGRNLDIVRFLLAHGADVNAEAKDLLGTPLHCAAFRGHKAMVELLIARGANVNAKGGEGWLFERGTPLHTAAWMFGDPEIAELLIAAGADLNAKDEDGCTPLHYAADNGHKPVAVLLIEKGADVNAKDKWAWTPLHYACWENYREMAEFLLTKGADLNAREEKGKTPLSVAKEEGNTEIVELLRKHGAKE